MDEVVASDCIHMHHAVVKNNAVEIKIRYAEAEESMFALQMSWNAFLNFTL